jgi:NADPH:quinone reductase-like Zn-dependent oxidoreductase
LTLPYTPGVDVVGRVYSLDARASRRYRLKAGDRIISLVKWGGNARFLSLDASRAIVVSESVDPVDAVCLAETYLTAFQILHHGQAQRIRYRDDSLRGKTILLRGFASSIMAHAFAQLASNAGATNVFASAKLKHFEYLTTLGISPLDDDAKGWGKDMTGTIDHIISLDDVVEIPYDLLRGSGHVVILKSFGKSEVRNSSLQPKRGVLCGRKAKIHQYQTSCYDIYEAWRRNVDGCKLDLQHLVHLLECEKVEPNVIDRVSLSKVARAQELAASTNVKGFIVCDPWLVEKSRTVCL